jgi:hypothetical protein
MNSRYLLCSFFAVIACLPLRSASAQEVNPIEAPDTPGAQWAPAATGNFAPANRPTDIPIDYVVIHDIEGSAESAVSWFQNPKAGTSSHYVVSSLSGKIWQMVKERDVAWHAGNRDINRRSVGIEHEGFAGRPGFFNPIEYETSARLVREITTRYKIPRDRTHIISHAEVPHPTKPGLFGGASRHTDPGPYWDWNQFMTLVRNDAKAVDFQFPAVIHPGETLEASVRFHNTGDDAWPVFYTEETPPPGAAPSPVPVYLGTANPESRVSAFWSYKGWASPRMATMAEKEVAPGTTGRFVWKLTGPRILGTFSESFRLTKVPFAPLAPVGFGETITTTIRVDPWDIKYAAAGNEAKATLPISGLWDVYAASPLGEAKPRYQIAASTGTQIVQANQAATDGWIKLGRFRFDDPQKATIMRLDDAPGINLLRFVGPFPTS